MYSNFSISIGRVGVQDLVATSTIVEGEEITLSYVPAANEGSDQRNVRIEYLIEWYGFCCKCKTCCLEVSKISFSMMLVLHLIHRNVCQKCHRIIIFQYDEGTFIKIR